MEYVGLSEDFWHTLSSITDLNNQPETTRKMSEHSCDLPPGAEIDQGKYNWLENGRRLEDAPSLSADSSAQGWDLEGVRHTHLAAQQNSTKESALAFNLLQIEWAECEVLSEGGARSPSLIANFLNTERGRSLSNTKISHWLFGRGMRPLVNCKTYVAPQLISEYLYFLYAKRSKGTQHPKTIGAIEKEIQRIEPACGLTAHSSNHLKDEVPLLRRKFDVLLVRGGASSIRLIVAFFQSKGRRLDCATARKWQKQLHLTLHTRPRGS